LAAARIRNLSVEEINARLDNRFRLLTGGSRNVLPRQQTLRALIDWSYDLLKAQERILLCRLSLFAAGWTLEAAEKVCAGEEIEDWEVFDLLNALVDKSLVVYEEQGGRSRYRFLETIREYAREKLLESGTDQASEGRHAYYYAELTAEESKRLREANNDAFETLSKEADNLRAAMDWFW
jgi:predicted ATPase